jgi:hypothetical protein
MNSNPYVVLCELDKNRCAFCGDHFHVLRECEDAQKETNRLYNASVYHRNYSLRNQDEAYLLKWFASLKMVQLHLLFAKINDKTETKLPLFYSPNINEKIRIKKIKNCMDYFYHKYPEEINY